MRLPTKTANPQAPLKNIVFRKRGRPGLELALPGPAYENPRPVSAAKYRDLTELCRKGAIPQEYHGEYYGLHSSRNEPDRLNESDEEEELDENFEGES